ncbi:MAG TPA: hypothetical protein VHM92_03150 [Allosphingosinicella sp.]|nr:hypothetical protein [Allosphingosinicella sp.]
MFDFSNMKQTLTAAVGALILSATAIAAAVGPARAIETGPSLSNPSASIVAHV